MRQVAAIELRHLLRFSVGRVPRGHLLTMQVQDSDRRAQGAHLAVDHVMKLFEHWEVLAQTSTGVRPVDLAEREELLFALFSRLPKSTINDLRSGHQGTHSQACDRIVDQIEERIADWHILVQEPDLSNGFACTRLPWDHSDIA